MADLQRDGYYFVGWYIDEARTKRINPGAVLPTNITLYDKWVPIKYGIHYKLNEGVNSRMNPKTLTIESGIQKLYPALLPGMFFKGWYDQQGNRVEYIPEGLHEDVYLEAVFTKHPLVQFETGPGASLKPIEVDEQGHVPEFRSPKRMGYDFLGWFLDPEYRISFDPDAVIRDSITLYAKWHLHDYKIEYELDGGFIDYAVPVEYTHESIAVILPRPRKRGWIFTGWTDGRGNPMHTIPSGSIGDKKIYANWRIDEPEVHAAPLSGALCDRKPSRWKTRLQRALEQEEAERLAKLQQEQEEKEALRLQEEAAKEEAAKKEAEPEAQSLLEPIEFELTEPVLDFELEEAEELPLDTSLLQEEELSKTQEPAEAEPCQEKKGFENSESVERPQAEEPVQPEPESLESQEHQTPQEPVELQAPQESPEPEKTQEHLMPQEPEKAPEFQVPEEPQELENTVSPAQEAEERTENPASQETAEAPSRPLLRREARKSAGSALDLETKPEPQPAATQTIQLDEKEEMDLPKKTQRPDEKPEEGPDASFRQNLPIEEGPVLLRTVGPASQSFVPGNSPDKLLESDMHPAKSDSLAVNGQVAAARLITMLQENPFENHSPHPGVVVKPIQPHVDSQALREIPEDGNNRWQGMEELDFFRPESGKKNRPEPAAEPGPDQEPVQASPVQGQEDRHSDPAADTPDLLDLETAKQEKTKTQKIEHSQDTLDALFEGAEEPVRDPLDMGFDLDFSPVLPARAYHEDRLILEEEPLSPPVQNKADAAPIAQPAPKAEQPSHSGRVGLARVNAQSLKAITPAVSQPSVKGQPPEKAQPQGLQVLNAGTAKSEASSKEEHLMLEDFLHSFEQKEPDHKDWNTISIQALEARSGQAFPGKLERSTAAQSDDPQIDLNRPEPESQQETTPSRPGRSRFPRWKKR